MALGFEVFDGLSQEIPEIPAGSVVSRMIFTNPLVRVSLMGFAAGQRIIERMPNQPAILEVWRGEGIVTLGEEVYEVGPGSWIYIGEEMSHVIEARTELVALLTILHGTDSK